MADGFVRSWITVFLPLPLLLVLALLPTSATARTDVCGTLAADTVWTPDDVYLMTCSVTVPQGVTLTILPGTVVKSYWFTSSSIQLYVEGRLVAEGTAEAPIVFTSFRDDSYGGDTNEDGSATQPAPFDWASINFYAGSSGSLVNTRIRFGGTNYDFHKTQAMVRCFDATLTLDRVVLEFSNTRGLYAERCDTSFTNGSVANNVLEGLSFKGLHPQAPLVVADNVFGSGLMGILDPGGEPHGPIAIRDNVPAPGTAGAFIVHGKLSGELEWDSDELVLHTQFGLEVGADATLRLMPGTVVKSIDFNGGRGGLTVLGRLLAEGTRSEPIVFTSIQDDEHGGDTNGDGPSSGAPAQWNSITVGEGGYARVAHAEILNGGYEYDFFGTQALLRCFGGEAELDDVTIRNSSYNAIYSENCPIRVSGSRIYDNNVGAIFNNTPPVVIDARYNWWGDPSGPYHPSKNPSGLGGTVSDGVLFFPWAIDAEGTVPSRVNVEGPTRVSPGETAQYAVSYYASEAMADAVLALVLPSSGSYTDTTGGGLYWPQRHTAFWRLGSISEGTEGSVSVQLRFSWGLPVIEESAMGLLGGPAPESDIFDATPFLDYDEPYVSAQVELTDSEFETERSRYPDLDALYTKAIADGFRFLQARSVTWNETATSTQAMLLRIQTGSLMILNRNGDEAYAIIVGGTSYSVTTAAGGMTMDLESGVVTPVGSWVSDADNATSAGSTQGQAIDITRGECLRNCIIKVLALLPPKLLTTFLGAAISIPECAECGRGDPFACGQCAAAIAELSVRHGNPKAVLASFGVDTVKCFADCNDPAARGRHVCDNDLTQCAGVGVSFFGRRRHAFVRWQCNRAHGMWHLVPRVLYCGPAETCVPGYLDDRGRPCQGCTLDELSGGATPTILQGAAQPTGSSAETCSRFPGPAVRQAHDPNEKLGIGGDVVPSEALPYRVTYENEGAGRAFGVYVTDQLSPHLDETTLDLDETADYYPSTRTIVWRVGELAPKGQEGSKGEVSFSADLRPDLPSGTVVTNQAVVFFPSVPEETSTNSVVNVVQPLAAFPQSLETEYGTPIEITLEGRDVSNTPLTFTLQGRPLHGELSGTAPNLTYAPRDNFTGQDQFEFTVNNGVGESRPAEVTIVVVPSASDSTAPEIFWTSPGSEETLEGISPNPVSGEGEDPLYSPSVRVTFSEAMEPTTIDTNSVSVRDGSGEDIPAWVSWDATTNQAVLLPRQPWQNGTYSAKVTTAVRDASGNPLTDDFTWSFRVGSVSACAGDCNADGSVSISELIRGVNIALGSAALEECESFDANGDGRVNINELIQGVNNALGGCSLPSPTVTPTRTVTGGMTSTRTPTRTASRTQTATRTSTASPSRSASPSATASQSPTGTATMTRTPTASATPTQTQTATATRTATRTATTTSTATRTSESGGTPTPPF